MEFKSYVEKRLQIRSEYVYARLMEYMLEEHIYSSKSDREWTILKLEEIRNLNDRYYARIRDTSCSRLRAITADLFNKNLIDRNIMGSDMGDIRFDIKSVSDFVSFWENKKLELNLMRKGKIVK